MTGPLPPLPGDDMDGWLAVEPVDLSGFDGSPGVAPVAPSRTRDRERATIDLGSWPMGKLINANRDNNVQWRWSKVQFWQRVTRAAYVSGFEMPRAHIEIRFWFRDLKHRDMSNLYLTTKGIVDGLVSKPDQFGWLPDDNDRVTVGPDPRRGLDPSIPKNQVRITVTITELFDDEEDWWNVPEPVKAKAPRKRKPKPPPVADGFEQEALLQIGPDL